MKAKRIVSILLTGSMLLSLLPVSALAAAPVFDAPAQTTAKKTAPLVQEADASRSTEEEAATRSSRDPDAENGTASSFTIDLKADGTPTESGDDDHWHYDPNSNGRLYLTEGVFTLQPSKEPNAESALQVVELNIEQKADFAGGTVHGWTNNRGIISGGTFQEEVYNNDGTISDGTFQEEVYNNDGTISGGTFQREVHNWSTISDGIFQQPVDNHKTISGGTFQKPVDNYGGTISGGTFQREAYNWGTISDGIFQQPVDNHKTISGGTFQKPVNNYKTISGGTFWEPVEVYASAGQNATIEGGTFERTIMLMNGDASITIKDGLFDDEVVTVGCASLLSISGGLFTKAVDLSNIDDPTNLQITGGYFVSKPTVPEGSDTTFAAVSDQAGRAFQVPVNGDWSESYTSLYVPRGSSGQHNTITVKTNTKLLYYLADGERVPIPDSDSDSYVYQIPVQSFEKIVLVTEEPAPPTPDEPGELDPGFSSGAAVLGAVLGTAGLGYIAYAHISSVYLYYALPGGFIPSTRQELANVLWTTAGKPDPVSTALYTDIPADAIEQQKAARWCAEQGLLSDHGATFGPDTKVTNARIIRAWNSLKKVPVPIK